MTHENEFLFEDARPTPPNRPSGRSKKSAKAKAPSDPGSAEVLPASRQHQTVIALDDPYVMILASAGTGKTFQLTNRYLTLLRSNSPDRILASTFTRKAAGEILDRVLVRLAHAVTDEDSLRTLSRFTGQPSLTLEECQTLLQNVTQQLHRMQISTLDSLFSKLASSHAFELGFPPGWNIMEDVETAQLVDQAIEVVLRQAGRTDARRLMHLLSKGESSRRVHDLIRETFYTFTAPYQITEEAHWNCIPDLPLLNELELSAAVTQFECLRYDDKRVMSAVEKSRQHIRNNNWEEFLTEGLGLKIVRGETTYYSKELPEDLLAAYAPLIEHGRALFYQVWSSQTRGTWETLHRVHTALDRLKNEYRLLDFSDISRRLGSRISDRNVTDLHFRLDVNLDHLLLDEFQDTSLIQWQILRPFAEATTQIPPQDAAPQASTGTTGGSAQTNSFFCVGDRKQAIYGWRGGEAAIFDTIQHEFPHLERRQLDVSRRSCSAVIDAVNQAFHSLRGTTTFDEMSPMIAQWCDQFPTHDTARQDLHGFVQLESVAPSSNAVSDCHLEDDDSPGTDGLSAADKPANAGKQRRISKAERTNAVLEHTADQIARYAQIVPGASIAALFRNNAPIRLLADKLRSRGVEFSEEGGTLLTDSAAVQLLLSLLKIADHPGDRVARFHVASSPLSEIHQFYRWDDDLAAIQLSEHLRSRLLSDGYLETMQRWERQLRDVATPHDRQRLRQLVELAERYTTTPRPRDFVRLVETRKVGNTTPARIQLMTIHQSKGLQFDIVFLADLDTALAQPPKYLTARPREASPPDRVLVYRSKTLQPLLPPELQVAYEQTQTADLTSSLCVLYVAMTRAVHALHMIVPQSDTKKVPKTSAGLLMTGLGNGGSNGGLYESGDPNWFQYCSALQRPVPLSRTVSDTSPITLAPLVGGRRRGMERVIPSAAVDRATRIKLTSSLFLGNSEGVDRGTIFHAWMEQLEWLDGHPPSDDELRHTARLQGINEATINEWISQFQRLLRQRSLVNLLSRTAYTTHRADLFPLDVTTDLSHSDCELGLRREQRFSVIDSGQLISGSIDRLVLIYQNDRVAAADILDFKTDAIDSDDEKALQSIANAYRDQMRSYRRAISLIHRLPSERISTRLVLLSTGVILNLPGTDASSSP